MTTQHNLENIQKELLKSFLNIPSTMARLFDIKVLEKLKENEESMGNEEEKNNLLNQEEDVDSLISSASETDADQSKLIEKIKKKNKEKKIAIDLFSGKAAEHFFINRVDRDVFDLKYHNNFIFNQNYNLSKLIDEDIPIASKELNEFIKYLNQSSNILNFFKMINMNLEGEIDFIINDVKKDDIIKILNDISKKYYIFGDENLFLENSYEIFGEITINLFHPNNYIKKLKQLLRYITTIKLYEKYQDFFFKKKIKKAHRAIMIITNGNYIEFIDRLVDSKIFSKDYDDKNNEFQSESIDKIIKCKKYQEEIKDYQNHLDKEKNLNKEFKKQLSDLLNVTDIKEIKKNYTILKKDALSKSEKVMLKSRTKNLLKILKASKIPFIIVYFPKIGGEFPYNLFKDEPIFIEKIKSEEGHYKYQFVVKEIKEKYIKKDEFENLKASFEAMKEKLQKQNEIYLKKINEQQKEIEELKKKIDKK